MLYAAVVFALGVIATPVAIAVLGRLQVVDVPNARSSHTRPTVRGAGVGVALVGTSALAAAGVSTDADVAIVAVAAAAYAAVGLTDDLRDLSVRYRLPLQVVISVGAVVVAGTIGHALLVLVAIAALVGYLNAFNFMDGINGISGFHAVGVGLTWTAAGLLSDSDAAVLLGAVLTAAALAFLPYNFPHARGFLGDVGSYFFGGWIAVSAVVLYGQVPVLAIVLPLTPYAADTAWTLFRRIRRGETWHEAHREHVYQRLVGSGWSHTRTALLVGVLTLSSGGGGLVGAYVLDGLVADGALVLLVVALLIAYLALPTLTSTRRREQASA